MTNNKFNPDYADDPETLRGALADAIEAQGHTQAKLEAAEKENKRLRGALIELKEYEESRIRVGTGYDSFVFNTANQALNPVKEGEKT